ncbi:MAG: metalloregulator ArsR/SmtB family transcription factor [Acidobacteria bacterium]|nr:metalloregulator ArsR/SmtB family transcription factor [Acidobacteriota bacterium]
MSNFQNDSLAPISETFSALGNPSRLQILHRLMECCDATGTCECPGDEAMCVGDLAKGLRLAPSTVSHHLKELRRAGLISMHRRGRNIDCLVNKEAIDKLVEFLGSPWADKETGC